MMFYSHNFSEQKTGVCVLRPVMSLALERKTPPSAISCYLFSKGWENRLGIKYAHILAVALLIYFTGD